MNIIGLIAIWLSTFAHAVCANRAITVEEPQQHEVSTRFLVSSQTLVDQREAMEKSTIIAALDKPAEISHGLLNCWV